VTLSTQARRAQRAAALLVARDLALQSLVELLDPGRTRSSWQVAGEVAQLLSRFTGEPYRRIRSGARAPRGAIEPLLLRLAEGGTPTSQRRVYGLLAQLVD
jgi:hypothetical protein